MPAKIQVIFYSTYGHVYRLAEAVAEGARGVPDTSIELLRVRETLSEEEYERYLGRIQNAKFCAKAG